MLIFILIAALPAIVLTILGFVFLKNNRKTAIIMFIIAGAYLLIGAGICGVLISSFRLH